MIRPIFAGTLLLVFAVVTPNQSGRRVTPSATPEPAKTSTDAEYSESQPRPGRIRRPMETVLPPVIKTSGSSDDDGEIVRVTTDLVTIPVSVFDRNGLYIPGIRQTEFKIFEDGIEQDIAYFGTTEKPFTVALVLDTSPSTEYKIGEIHRAAEAFVRLLQPHDRVIVIEFYHRVKVHTEATSDRERIIKAIYKAQFGGGTSLYNAVDEALRKQLGKIEGRKAVVLFTDGVDTTSNKNSYDSTLNYAEESDSLVFPIYYNTYLDNRRRNTGIFGGVWSGVSAEEYAVGRRYLEDLADVTGGRVFRAESTPGGLMRAFEGIAEELRRQYNIGYVPKTEGKPGQRRQIRVRIERPNLVIRARDHYIVGATVAAPPQSTRPGR